MTLTKPLRSVLFLSALAALPACNESRAAQARSSNEAAAVRVETVEVREEQVPSSLSLTGTLRGARQTELAANAAGKVLETYVERGAQVKKGDLLARLDVRAASLSAAEARLAVELSRKQGESAKRECARYEALLGQGAIGQAELDRVADQCRLAPLSLSAAEARAGLASLAASDGAIRAPFAGLISERFVEVGQYLRPDSRVVSIADIDTLRLELTVPEDRIASLKEGGALTFTVAAYPDRIFEGTVKHIAAAVRETTRDLIAEAVVNNADHTLRPGMFASAALRTGDVKATVIPKEAVVTREGHREVYTVVDHRLEQRVVQLGVEKGALVAVTRGLALGERVVVKPAPTLQNGQAVE
ncbi:MAG: efflux RND transporter periplasmic adaptor subunit [Minicystis sp.]